MTINFKSWKTWAVLAGLLILLYIIFRSREPKNNGDELIKKTESLMNENNMLKFRHVKDSLEFYSFREKSNKAIDSLVNQKSKVEVSLAIQSATVRRLSSGIVTSKLNNDSTKYIINCDSLADIAEQRENTITEYVKVNTDLQTRNQNQIDLDNSYIAKQDEQISEKNSIIDKMGADLKQSAKENARLNKKLRTAQLLEKVEAGAIIVLGILVIL